MNMEALETIKAMDRAYITPAQAAEVLECDAQYIRIMAKDHPDQLGFPVLRLGRNPKIMRLPFIQFVMGGAWHDEDER